MQKELQSFTMLFLRANKTNRWKVERQEKERERGEEEEENRKQPSFLLETKSGSYRYSKV